MFDIGWSELMVVAVILVVVVGPKDLPRMLRTFGRTSKQLRSMAGDFRRQFDDALREAELDDVRDTVSKVRDLDPTKDVRAAMNPMKAVGDEIRSSLKAATTLQGSTGTVCSVMPCMFPPNWSAIRVFSPARPTVPRGPYPSGAGWVSAS